MSEYLKVEGLVELKAKFESLPKEIAEKVLRKGVAIAAILARERARAAAPIGAYTRKRRSGLVTAPGVLRKSAIVRFIKEDSNATQVRYIVTFRKGKRLQRSGRDAFYAGWVEFGHKIVPRGGKLSYGLKKKYTTITARRNGATSRTKRNDYLANSFASSKNAALATMTDVFQREFRKLYA